MEDKPKHQHVPVAPPATRDVVYLHDHTRATPAPVRDDAPPAEHQATRTRPPDGRVPRRRKQKAGAAGPTSQGAEAANNPREQLLDVAIQLFAAHGYETVSTTLVAEAAGLTQSMIHYYFGSKEQLWKSAVDLLVKRRGIVFNAVPHDLKDIPPIARLKVLVRRLFRANLHEPQFARIVMHEAIISSERLEWLLATHLQGGFGVMNQMLADAVADGSLKELPFHDVSSIVTAVASSIVIQGNLTRAIYGVDIWSSEKAEELEDAMITILFDGLSAPRA